MEEKNKKKKLTNLRILVILLLFYITIKMDELGIIRKLVKIYYKIILSQFTWTMAWVVVRNNEKMERKKLKFILNIFCFVLFCCLFTFFACYYNNNNLLCDTRRRTIRENIKNIKIYTSKIKTKRILFLILIFQSIIFISSTLAIITKLKCNYFLRISK